MTKLVFALALVAACKGKESEPAPVAPPPVAGCALLSEAKVKEITGVVVTATKSGNPQACAMFKTADGKDYLYVASDSAGSYSTFVSSNPPDMFPTRTPVTGVGSEAVLLRRDADPSSLRTLIAHGDQRSVQLTPQLHVTMPDDQLTALARVAVAAP